MQLEEGLSLTVGRSEEADVQIDSDTQVSAVHAELRKLAGEWVVIDDGMSSNGTFVNEELVAARRRLRDRDQLKVGETRITFRDPERNREATFVPSESERPPELSPAQRRVLVELCRPYRDGGAFARPATNKEVAEALHLTVAAVKTHLRTLFTRFAVEDLPQNEKRARLVESALARGAVNPVDLGPA